jgi:hypothetical protein
MLSRTRAFNVYIGALPHLFTVYTTSRRKQCNSMKFYFKNLSSPAAAGNAGWRLTSILGLSRVHVCDLLHNMPAVC